LQDPAAPLGTYHFVNAGEASWHDLAALIFTNASKRGLHVPKLKPITALEYPTQAKRPLNSRLSTTQIQTDFGIEPRRWTLAVDQVLSALA